MTEGEVPQAPITTIRKQSKIRKVYACAYQHNPLCPEGISLKGRLATCDRAVHDHSYTNAPHHTAND